MSGTNEQLDVASDPLLEQAGTKTGSPKNRRVTIADSSDRQRSSLMGDLFKEVMDGRKSAGELWAMARSVALLSKGERPKKDACVVFIAPTQHGKSTTIDKFYEAMSGNKPSDSLGLVLGNGTTSASKNTMMLPPCPVSYLSYAEWPHDDGKSRELGRRKKDVFEKFFTWEDKADLPKDLADAMYDLRHGDMLGRSNGRPYHANVQRGLPGVVDVDGEEYDLVLHILDTPGLDDSDGHGKDDVIISGLLEALSSSAAPDLCSFIFVVKAGMSWSGSFLSSAKRYWDQFPSFRDNWIFIHTGMDAFAEEFPSGNCFEEFCEQRKKDLVHALANTFDEEPGKVTGLPHIFVENIGLMDSRRKTYKQKSEFQLMERAKAFNSLVMKLCSTTMKPLEKLDYRKSPENQQLDNAMVQIFEQRKHGVQSALAPLKAAHGRFIEKIMATTEKRQELDQWIRTAKVDILKKDSKELILKDQKRAFEEWTFWGSRHASYTLTVPYAKSGVKHSCVKNSGYPSGKARQESFKYDPIENTTEWTVACSSAWCRGYEFDLQLKVESRLVYAEEVKVLKDDMRLKEEELLRVQKDYDDLRLEDRTLATEIEAFTKQTTFFGECTYLSNQKTVELGRWKTLQAFYTWAASEEGQDMFQDPERSDQIIMKFCTIHGIADQYKETCGVF